MGRKRGVGGKQKSKKEVNGTVLSIKGWLCILSLCIVILSVSYGYYEATRQSDPVEATTLVSLQPSSSHPSVSANLGRVQIELDKAASLQVSGLYDEAIITLEAILPLESTLSKSDHVRLFNMLAMLYIDEDLTHKASTSMELAMNTRRDSDSVQMNYWYGVWIASQLRLEQYEEVSRIVERCFRDFEVIAKHPHYCYHQAAMNSIFSEKLPLAHKYFYENYKTLTERWNREDSDEICPGQFVPLNLPLDSEYHSELIEARNSIIVNSDMTLGISGLVSEAKCSEQRWPFVVEQDGNVYNDSTHIYNEMRCIESKRAPMYHVTNVVLRGENKMIIQENPDSCILYQVGYPYVNMDFLPIPFSEERVKEHLQKPTIYIENALILHPHKDKNYFHTSIEGLSKLIFVLKHPELRAIQNLRILVANTSVVEQYFELLNITHMLEPYRPSSHRYQIENVYAIDWMAEQTEIKEPVHIKDTFVPTAPALHLYRSVLHKIREEKVGNSSPRDTVIFLHRDGTRSIREPNTLYAILQFVCHCYGLRFELHGAAEERESIVQQMEMFSRAVAVIGVHGAGFSNMIHCQENTSIIEVPVTPYLVSVYSRMSSILQFPYYSIPSATFQNYKSTKLSDRAIMSIEATLRHVLENTGYSRVLPQYPKYYSDMIKVYGKIDAAEHRVMELLEELGATDLPARYNHLYYDLAQKLIEQGRYKRVVQVTKKAIANLDDLSDLDHWYGIEANAYFQLKNMPELINTSRSCVQLFEKQSPKREPVYCLIAATEAGIPVDQIKSL